ncbi:MAG: extracellular solute-binding protein [Actinomycetes bacterium]|jgi:multiple sugar transport system substrate-binding protein
MKKMTKRSLAAIASLGLVAGALVAAAPAQAADITIKVLTPNYTDNMAAYYKDLETRFMAANPTIKVEHENVSWDDILVKGRTLISTKSYPDVLNLNTFSEFAAEDLLYKASDLFDATKLSDFVPAFRDNSKYKGVEYAVPDLASARMFFINKALFYGAGNTKIPTTWAEVTAAAKKIKAKYGSKVYPLAIPLGSEEAQAEFQIWAGGNGGRYFDEASSKWVINSAENLATLNQLKAWVKAGYTQPNPASTNRTDAFKLFSQGKVAMINASVFFPSTLKDYKSKVDYGVAPFPAATAAKKPITLGVQDYFMAFKKAGNQDAVSKYLNFLYSASNYAGFLKATGGFIPATKSASTEVDSSLLPFIEQLPNAIFYPGTLGSWGTVVAKITTQIGTGITKDAKTVLNSLQATAEAAGTK